MNKQDAIEIKDMVKRSPTPPAMLAMSILSDAQHLIEIGHNRQASELMNTVKLIIDEFCSTKDKFGRHIKTGEEF